MGENMKCIYTGENLDSKTTAEHILQAFTGAKWKSKYIASNSIQRFFSTAYDNSMAECFAFIRNLLNIAGDHKSAGPKGSDLQDSKGHKYRLRHGQYKLIDPIVSDPIDIDENIKNVTITMGDRRDYGLAEHLVRQKIPNGYKIVGHSELKSMSVTSAETGMLKTRITFLGVPCMKAILKSSFNLLGANDAQVAHLRCFDALRSVLVDVNNMDIHKFCEVPKQTEYLPLPKSSIADHILTVYTNRDRVLGFARLYGQFCFSMLLTSAYNGPDFRYAYFVNPYAHSDNRDCNINFDILPEFEGINDASLTFDATQRAFERLLNDYYDQELHKSIQSIVDAVFAKYKDEPVITEAMMNEVLQNLFLRLEMYE